MFKHTNLVYKNIRTDKHKSLLLCFKMKYMVYIIVYVLLLLLTIIQKYKRNNYVFF